MCIRDSEHREHGEHGQHHRPGEHSGAGHVVMMHRGPAGLSLIHISEPTRLLSISYAVFCLAHETPEHLVCRLLLGSYLFFFFFFLMIRRPPRSTRVRSSAASDVYKRQARVTWS